jgi:hypothetical protein
VRIERDEPRRYPWWQLLLLGVVAMIETLLVRPLHRLWASDDPLDTYALVHLTSAGGDALIAIALAGSVFFGVPIGQAKTHVALYLALTMAPLAVASPLLVPLLDGAGPRRAISFGAAGGRLVVAAVLAAAFGSVLVYPLAFLLLVLSKVHAITKNGLTAAYAGRDEGLVRANARLGRIAVYGVVLASILGLPLLRLAGPKAVAFAAAGVYAIASALNLRLPHPRMPRSEGATVGPRGAIPALRAPAIGAAGLRAASGFLLFLFAFALRREGDPAWWFAVLGAAGTIGAFAGDLLAPRLPASLREDAVVIACVVGAAIGAVVAFEWSSVPVLAAFALVVGTTGELGRLAFQSLMQRLAPGGAHGRVYVRYEVVFQLSWVGGALVTAMLPIGVRDGFLILFGLYLVVGIGYLAPGFAARRARRGSA